MQEIVTRRIVIYAKDVSLMTGLAPRTAWNLLARIRKKYKKSKGQFVTVSEFSDYTGISIEDIYKHIP